LDLPVLVAVVCLNDVLAVDVCVNVRLVVVGRSEPIPDHRVVQPVSQAVWAVPSGADELATAWTLQAKDESWTPPADSR